MSSKKQNYPFLYRELSGTRWFRRFLSDEFEIFLDQYPQRSIISDYQFPPQLQEQFPQAWNAYRNRIIELFTGDDDYLKTCSPWDILLYLRRERQNAFAQSEIISSELDYGIENISADAEAPGSANAAEAAVSSETGDAEAPRTSASALTAHKVPASSAVVSFTQDDYLSQLELYAAQQYPGFELSIGQGFIETLFNVSSICYIPSPDADICTELEAFIVPLSRHLSLKDEIQVSPSLVHTSESAKRHMLFCYFNDEAYGNINRKNLCACLDRLNISYGDKNLLALDLPLNEDQERQIRKSTECIFTSWGWAYRILSTNDIPICFAINNSEWLNLGFLQHPKFLRIRKDFPKKLESPGYGAIMQHTDSMPQGVLYLGNQLLPLDRAHNFVPSQYSSISIDEYLSGKRGASFFTVQKQLFREMNGILGLKPILSKNDTESENKNRDLQEAAEGVLSGRTAEKLSEPRVLTSAIQMMGGETLLTAVSVPEQQLEIRPIFFNHLTDSSRFINTESGSGFLSSFNYYFTENLSRIYNKRVPDSQHIGYSNFLIDYIYFSKMQTTDTPKSCETVFETLPLYHKGFLGSTKEGRLFSGYFPVRKIQAHIGKRKFVFYQEDINTQNTSQEHEKPFLYLPSFMDGRDEEIGKGQWCMVIIQDQIVSIQRGPVHIPPVGSVITGTQLDIEYLSGQTVEWNVDLDELPVPKSEIDWMVGGLNLLVYQGRNLYETADEARLKLSQEGWFSEQSAATQETQLEPGVVQPRCAVGRTREGKIISAVFSGRTHISAGAALEEIAQAVQEHILQKGDELDFLVNLDGGSSAGLSWYHEGRCSPLTIPSPSANNPAGVPRLLPAYLDFHFKGSKM